MILCQDSLFCNIHAAEVGTIEGMPIDLSREPAQDIKTIVLGSA